MAANTSASGYPKVQAAAAKRRTSRNRLVDCYRRRNAIIIPNPLSKYAIIDPDMGDHSLNVHRQRQDHADAMARKLLNLSISTSNVSASSMANYRQRCDSVPNPLAPVHRATDTNSASRPYKLISPSLAQHFSWSRSKLSVKGYRNFVTRRTIQRNKERIIKMGNPIPFSKNHNQGREYRGVIEIQNSESPVASSRDPFGVTRVGGDGGEVDTKEGSHHAMSKRDLNAVELFSMRDHHHRPFGGSFGRRSADERTPNGKDGGRGKERGSVK